MPAPGEPAPPFDLADGTGQRHRLREYLGRWVVLYFYPRDGTPGCTAEACRFRDAHGRLQALGAVVVGVSTDAAPRHAAFAARHDLPFLLLADPDGTAAAAYGALRRFGPWRWARRCTFLIDPDGRIARRYRRVSVPRHSEQVIADLTTLQGPERRSQESSG